MEVRQFSVAAALAVLSLTCACSGGGETTPPAAHAPGGGSSVPGAPGFTSLGPSYVTYAGVPASGKVNALAVDPSNSNTLFIAAGRGTGLESYSSAGVYRSSNGGATWTPADAGLTDPGGLVSSVVNALWIDPQAPSHLVAATETGGLFETLNSGALWTNVYATTGASQIVRFGGSLYATSAAGVLTSPDNGATWSVSLPTSGAATALGFGGSSLYAGDANGVIYLRTAATSTTAGALPFQPSSTNYAATAAVHQIAVDPITPTTVYAAANDGAWNQQLFASTTAGNSWSAVSTDVWSQAIAFSNVTPHQLYIGGDGGFGTMAGDGATTAIISYAQNLAVVDIRNVWPGGQSGSGESCWLASDQGLDFVPNCANLNAANNDRVVSYGAGMSLARHIAVGTGGNIIASFQDLDVMTSTNGASSWNEQNFYEDAFVALNPANANLCYIYDEYDGFRISNDGCRTFAPANASQSSIAPSRLMTNAIAFDPKSSSHMYVLSGSPGWFGNITSPNVVFETTDGGQSFSPDWSWPFLGPGSIEIDKHNGLHMMVSDLGYGSSSVAVTWNGGKTWTRATGVPPTPYWYSISMSPVSGANVVIAGADAQNNVFTLQSTDGGQSFTGQKTVVAKAAITRSRAGERKERGHHVEEASGGVQRYYVYSPVRRVLFNPDQSTGVPCAVLTTSTGAYESCDGAASWTRFDQPLIAHSFWDAQWVNGTLYLATDGQGVVAYNGTL